MTASIRLALLPRPPLDFQTGNHQVVVRFQLEMESLIFERYMVVDLRGFQGTFRTMMVIDIMGFEIAITVDHVGKHDMMFQRIPQNCR